MTVFHKVLSDYRKLLIHREFVPELIDTGRYLAFNKLFGHSQCDHAPVHLCFLVTKDYFNAGLLRSYQHLILPALGVMLSAALLFMISRTVLGL